jgi:hypothetical protein
VSTTSAVAGSVQTRMMTSHGIRRIAQAKVY